MTVPCAEAVKKLAEDVQLHGPAVKGYWHVSPYVAILSYSILFYSILFYSILFYCTILFYSEKLLPPKNINVKLRC